MGIPAEQVTVRGKEGGEPPKRVNINVIRKIQGVWFLLNINKI